MTTQTQPQSWVGVSYAVAAALGFALSLVTAKLSYEYGTDAQSVMLVRFVAMLGVLLFWIRLLGLPLALRARDGGGSLLCGLLYFFSIFSYLSSVAWLPVSLSVLIFYTYPILVALMTAALLRRMPSKFSVFALLLAFAGLMLALDVRSVQVSGLGLGFAICASVGMTLNVVFSARLLQRVQTQVFTFYMSVASALLASVVVYAQGGLHLPEGAMGWTAFAVSLFGFFIGFICTFNAIARLQPLRFASLMNLEPVATILFALLLLSEVLTGLQMIGSGIVIVGVVMAQLASNSSVPD